MVEVMWTPFSTNICDLCCSRGARIRPSVRGESLAVVVGKNADGMVPFAEKKTIRRLAAGAPASRPNAVAGRQMGLVSATVIAPNPLRRRRRLSSVR
jgi:hypothetical protein